MALPSPIQSLETGLSTYSLYSGTGCNISRLLGIFFYDDCYGLPLPEGILVSSANCTVPVPPPPPPPPVPPPPPASPPNSTCVWIFLNPSATCTGAPIQIVGAPCDDFCTSVFSGVSVSIDCSNNFTALYANSLSFPGCTSFQLGRLGDGTCIQATFTGFNLAMYTRYNTTCPASIPTPTPTPTPPPPFPWCMRYYAFPGCSMVFVNQSNGTCGDCVAGTYTPTCGVNITRWRSSPCNGAVQAQFAYNTCYNDGLGYSRIFYNGVVPVRPLLPSARPRLGCARRSGLPPLSARPSQSPSRCR